MASIYVDVGNSNIKWRGGRGGVVHSRPRSDFAALMDELHLQQMQADDRVLVASVADDDWNAQFVRMCLDRWGGEPTMMQVRDDFAGLKLAYEDVSKLGVDRWLAMLAARESHPEKRLLVLDVGSAVTADVLSSDGVHQGGYIAPGLPLFEKLFLEHADRVDIQTLNLSSQLQAGGSTVDCVQNGVTAMLKGFVQEVLRIETIETVVWTGGMAEALRSLCHVPGKGISQPYAVLDGLALVEAHQS